MDAIWRNVRIGLRAMRRSPGVTLVAVVTLAVGIGAATSIFTVVNGALLRPLPYPEPDRLVSVTSALAGSGYDRLGLTEPEYLRLREERGAFAALGVYVVFNSSLTGIDEPARVRTVAASADLLTALGARPALGRAFSEEEAVGDVPVALISDGAWRRRLGADPAAVGRTIVLNGTAVTVVGVLPPGLAAPSDLQEGEPAEVWLPLTIEPANPNWGSHYLAAVGRLAPGATPAAARATVQGVVDQLAAARPDAYPKADGADAPPAAVVNETLARRFFPGESPLGRRLRLYWRVDTRGPWVTVVGVVGDSRITSLAEEPQQELFLAAPQVRAVGGWVPRAMSLVVRTAGPPAALAAPVREAVRRLDPALPLYDVGTMDQVVMGTLARERFGLVLLGGFAALALVLAAVGIYCLIAYSVTRRRREIGVRVALGARPADVFRQVVGSGVRLTLAGLAAGLAAAAAGTRLLAGQLHDVSTTDPATFAAVSALLLAVAVTASYLPARRATRLDPMTALRAE